MILSSPFSAHKSGEEANNLYRCPKKSRPGSETRDDSWRTQCYQSQDPMAPTAMMDGHLVVVRHSESLAQGGLAKCSGQCSWDNRLLRRLRAHVKYNQTYARRWKLQSCFPTRATYWCAARGGAGALTSRTMYHGCAPVNQIPAKIPTRADTNTRPHAAQPPLSTYRCVDAPHHRRLRLPLGGGPPTRRKLTAGASRRTVKTTR